MKQEFCPGKVPVSRTPSHLPKVCYLGRCAYTYLISLDLLSGNYMMTTKICHFSAKKIAFHCLITRPNRAPIRGAFSMQDSLLDDMHVQ